MNIDSNQQKQKMKLILFYAFLSLYILIVFITLAMILFNFGGPTETERSALFYTFIIEIGIAMIALFYSIFEIKKTKEKNKESNIKVFPASRNKEFNKEFYDYFIRVINEAKEDIYIIGDGFECKSPDGKNISEKYMKAFRYALNKNVRVVRIETKSKASSIWAGLLADLVKDYPKLFKLYVFKEPKATQMASICLIDPEMENENVIEIMLSIKKHFGVESTDLAGTAIFIKNQRDLAIDTRGKIINLIDDNKQLKYLATYDIVKETLSGESFYFSYGSNMSEGQIKERCSSAKKIDIGYLTDYEIVFNRKGSYRSGGVASIRPSSGKKVYGVIWQIDNADLYKLDKVENPEAYRREKIEVSTESKKKYNCHLYIAMPEGEFHPNEEYIKIMINAAKAQSLPEDYVSYLEGFQNLN